ncbi:hypothetical protein ABZ816_15125 [Actinosynnema sp. NPDC047251]|uniref:Putative secreted protein n=1 Tax=Saccharothrix espanaensis (strain ATCC 51144 / DSM 44229 / JCM 9112 / NBRC 15066 / NRRL 15764) TaxID=1179773 RepID=K0JZG0_SACES|nr:hypothetical protein [Saccharothrix espanaensis]CCH29648.1 putative secreted protein [Saccharothrix espanaensis DSM 44229]
MTPLLIALRRGSARVGVPMMVLLGLYAATRGDAWPVDPGWTSGRMPRHGELLLPLVAAFAAWDVSRDRRAGSDLEARTYPRSPVPWLLLNCLGAVLAGLAGWVVAVAVGEWNAPDTRAPYWSVVLLEPLWVVAAALVGAAAGRRLHRRLAAPIVAVVGWLGLAFGPAADPLVARLGPLGHECCDVASQPVAATVAGQWLWVVALAFGAVAVSALPEVGQSVAIAAVTLVVGFLAVTVVRGTGGQSTEARRATEVCGSRDGVTVCMWPEHATSVAAWLGAIGRYRTLFADLGPPPDLYLANGLRPQDRAERVGPVRPGTDEVYLVTDLAQRLVPSPPACAAHGDEPVPYPAAQADVLLRAWLAHRVRPDVPTTVLVPPEHAEPLARLVGSDVDRQRAWYADVVRAHGDCTTPAPPVP